MQLRNKIYPYPVITEGGDYYKNSTFTSSVSQALEGYDIKVSISVNLNDEKLSSMVSNGDLLYVHHFECPQTCYRRIVKTRDDNVDVLLKDSEVNGIVQICSFVVAAKDIEKYTNDSFSQDYMGWKFNIDKGCIMAIGKQYDLRVNKQRDDLANTSSIFSIVKNLDPLADSMTISLSQQKIVITLPEITFSQYTSVQNYIDVQPVMHSMLIIPALMYVFSELKNSGNQLYEYEDLRWFRGLRKACEAIGITISEESVKTLDAVKTAQLLLNNPITKAIEFCALGGSNYEN